MRFLIVYIFIFSSFFMDIYSQNDRLGISENIYVNQLKSNDKTSILVKGDKQDILRISKKYDANIKIEINSIFSIEIAQKNIQKFTNELKNTTIEIPVHRGSLLMDTAILVNKVQSVHYGTSPLTQSYKGSGVIVGILDAGIYFDHQDFKNPDGTTRLRYIWDQNISGNTSAPLPYNYGVEWSWLDINNGSCNHTEPSNQYGHGTTVSGIACGNGSATGYFTGIAPESEIIAVAVDYYDHQFLAHLLDAIDYVFKKSDALGKPCVINISLGTYAGSHDGKDLTTQMVEALLEEKDGRAIVAAAGNGNNIGNASSSYIPTHLSYPVTTDTSFTWFKTNPTINKIYFELWADTSSFKNVSFSFQNDNHSNFNSYGNTDFFSIANDFNFDITNGYSGSVFVLNDNNVYQGKVDYYIEETEGRYHLEFLITPDSLQNIWRFMTTGSGTFDIWSSNTFQGTSDMIFENLPPSFVVPDIINYQLPDNHKTIVSGIQCSDKVLSVANYSNRAKYYDVDSTLHFTSETPGEIYRTSSQGPTRDNRLKPDISATGNITFSTGNMQFINSALSVNRPKIAFDGLHNRNGGTSMSSPIVAGAVALYLEKNPSADWKEISEAIKQTAYKDNFTGVNANNVYGHGKLDAFNLMQFEAIFGCMNPLAFNYNSLANVEDDFCIDSIYGCIDSLAFNYDPTANTDNGSCIDVVYGCTDSLAINFSSLANTDTGTCEYDTNIEDILMVNTIRFFPNPLKNISHLKYNYNGKASVVIYSLLGKIILKDEIDMQNPLTINRDEFIQGLYFIDIRGTKNNVSKSIKFVVY